MYQFNEQFTKSYSQFADVAARANRLALENAEKAFGLYAAVLEENADATFAFMGQLVDVRDADGIKADYLDEVAAFQANYRKEWLGARIDYVPLHTGMPFDKALMEYLLSRQARG